MAYSECIYLITETLTLRNPKNGVENPVSTPVCAALDFDEAEHKTKFLNENADISNTPMAVSVEYNYKLIPLSASTSWLVDLNK